jgi:hypothetical protein
MPDRLAMARDISTTLPAGPEASEEENRKRWQAERDKRYKELSKSVVGVVAQDVEAVLPESRDHGRRGLQAGGVSRADSSAHRGAQGRRQNQQRTSADYGPEAYRMIPALAPRHGVSGGPGSPRRPMVNALRGWGDGASSHP